MRQVPPEEPLLRAPGEDVITVAWWNIRDFSLTPTRAPDLAAMGRVLAAIGADVCAIGEVNDPAAVRRLGEQMGAGWSAVSGPKVGRTAGSREAYSFVWNAAKLDKVAGVTVDPDPGDKIDREPAWATFRTKDGRLDFTVLAVHITWGTTVAPRKAEIRALADVWNRTQTATASDDDLILVGDFNRDVGDDSFDRLLAIEHVVCANAATGPTSISGTSTYDQIYLDSDETTEWTGAWGTYAFDEIDFGGDDAKADKDVSNHRTVWIALKVPEADDD